MSRFEQLSHELPLGPQVRVIDCNQDGLVALDKPDGIMSHPNEHRDRKRSLLTAHYDFESECFTWEVAGEARKAWLLNRLDSPTSGVILLSLDQELSDVIKRQFASHKVTKVYYALCKNVPSAMTGKWNDSLNKDVYRGGRLVRGGLRVSAKTGYQVAKKPTGGFPVCLLKLMPLTGRTHQLRVQCSKHRHPIVGDKTYGSFSFNREVAEVTGEARMMLHSAETIVHYVFKGKVGDFHVQSPLPQAFKTVINFRPGLHHSSPARQQRSETKSDPGKSGLLEGRRFKQ